MIWTLIVGLAAGALAKMITPQNEKPGWISSLIIGVLGAYVGNRLALFFGLRLLIGRGLLPDIIIATGGAVLILWIYHNYLADKLKLPI